MLALVIFTLIQTNLVQSCPSVSFYKASRCSGTRGVTYHNSALVSAETICKNPMGIHLGQKGSTTLDTIYRDF